MEALPDRPPRARLLVPWEILGPTGLSNGEPNIEGRLPRLVRCWEESKPWSDGGHGQPPLRLVQRVHLERHAHCVQGCPVVPVSGPRLQALRPGGLREGRLAGPPSLHPRKVVLRDNAIGSLKGPYRSCTAAFASSRGSPWNVATGWTRTDVRTRSCTSASGTG